MLSAAMTTDPNSISKYRAGFNECAAEIARYLDNVNGGNPELKARVMGYLGNSMMQFPVIPVYQGVPYHMQITSPATSQGFSQQAFTPLSVPVAASTPYPQHYVHTEQTHNASRLRDIKPRHLNISPIKMEHTRNDVTSCTAKLTSPTRRPPSPCDSDSGLSDSSTSFSHDENGNYSHFNVNSNQQRNDVESRMAARVEPRHDVQQSHYNECRTASPKRKLDDAVEETPRKRQHFGTSNVDVHQRHQRNVNEPMWRPW